MLAVYLKNLSENPVRKRMFENSNAFKFRYDPLLEGTDDASRSSDEEEVSSKVKEEVSLLRQNVDIQMVDFFP